jgi:hypothetical protein
LIACLELLLLLLEINRDDGVVEEVEKKMCFVGSLRSVLGSRRHASANGEFTVILAWLSVQCVMFKTKNYKTFVNIQTHTVSCLTPL